MASRLLERLDGEVAAETDPYRRECLKAQRAAAIARLGLLGEARFALAGLRTQSRRLRRPGLQAWVHMTDGLIDHFDTLSPQARDKFLAARDLAEEASDGHLQAFASAWIANSDFNARHYEAMAQALLAALRGAADDDHATHARISLVRADASRHAGLHDAAVRHYADAHRHSVADGDTAMISAMLHNRALFLSVGLVLDEVFGQPRRDEAARTLIEVESTGNLDRGLGNDALGTKVPLLRAELCTVLQRWGEALALFQLHVGQGKADDAMPRLAPCYLAHRAWCHWHLGAADKALVDADAAERGLDRVVDADDRAITHGRLAALFALAGQPERARVHQPLAERALAEFRASQARLAGVLCALDRASASGQDLAF